VKEAIFLINNKKVLLSFWLKIKEFAFSNKLKNKIKEKF
jgi:hypothetical protein